MGKLSTVFSAVLLCAVAACAAQNAGPSGGQPGSLTLPAIDRDLSVTAGVPAKTIGEELPSEGVGAVRSSHWKALVGGFTQLQYSEVLAFAPGTKITIRNLSSTTAHTFDVVKVISGPPARFPKNPSLSFSHQGGDKVQAGYASGVIKPGHSVTVVLVKGIYLIGCAFHYGLGMRDVLVVEDGVRPGPQATPTPPPATPTPTPGGTPTPYVSPTPTPTPTPTPLTVNPPNVDICTTTTACGATYPNSIKVTVELNGTPVDANVDSTQCTGYATVASGSSTGQYVVTGMGTRSWPCYVYFTTNAGNQGSLYVYVWNS